MVDRQECVHLTFVPQNPQDFGFTGAPLRGEGLHLCREEMYHEPAQEDGVNFVENLDIVQQFEQLPEETGC